MNDENKMLTKAYKEPREYGNTRYLVELFLTERFVVTVYADSEEEAVKRAKASPYRAQNSLIGFHCIEGVSHTHFDEDYDFQLTGGEVVLDDSEENG